MMSQQTYRITPIGTIHAGESGCYLEIAPEYRRALRGLEGFSHLQVLWWCHLCDTPRLRAILEADQPYRTAPPELGIFATRSPVRPNPIALTPVAVLRLDPEAGRIDIPYIDAEDGTPVLDIKPYHPSVDRVREVAVPAWCRHWPRWCEDSAAFDWEAEFVNAR
jgi:tRNA-Thr(GGU) m(6)t(6)A37 methyltransferase TsaA